MPISGLHLTLHDDPELAADAIGALRSRTEIELGTPRGRALPIMTEVWGLRQSRSLHQWIKTLPGVTAVELVYIAYDGQSGADPKPLPPAPTPSLVSFHAN